MTCRTLYDIKSVAYDTQDYSNYLDEISTTGFQQILIHKDGLTIDTKSENVEFTELNGTRYTDGERIPIREIGSIKFTKNFDSSLLVNHSELVKAGLGNISAGTISTITIVSGKGSVTTPFVITQDTATLAVGDLIYIPNFGFRAVATVDTETPFGCTVDTPLISTLTNAVCTVHRSIDLTNAIGNCEKTFNFVISLNDGDFIKMMGCGIQCEFNPVFEKQLTINFTVTSPLVTIESSITGFSTATAETKGTPVKCNFSKSLITDEDGEMVSYFPPSFDLGFSTALETIKAIGGLNNVIGYMNRNSIKPKITLDRIALCKSWVANPRFSRVYSFYQSNFGVYIAGAKLTLIDNTTNMNNHDVISCELDANYDKDLKVYLVLP